MKFDYKFFTFFLLIFLLPACNPLSIDDLAYTAVAKTKTVKANLLETPTQDFHQNQLLTPTIINDKTTTPNYAPTLFPPTSTYTPTPDLRVIDMDPRNFLLEKTELPIEPNYYIPGSNWMSPHRNYEVINELGEEFGGDYIDQTGRLDGWVVTYRKGLSRVLAPIEIYHNIIKYKDSQGALLAVREFNLGIRDSSFNYLDSGEELGDLTVVLLAEEVNAFGEVILTYRIETAYRNFVSIIMMVGEKDEIQYEFVENIAYKIINLLEDAPLSATVTTE
jgi:hypothetical protein